MVSPQQMPAAFELREALNRVFGCAAESEIAQVIDGVGLTHMRIVPVNDGLVHLLDIPKRAITEADDVSMAQVIVRCEPGGAHGVSAFPPGTWT